MLNLNCVGKYYSQSIKKTINLVVKERPAWPQECAHVMSLQQYTYTIPD